MSNGWGCGHCTGLASEQRGEQWLRSTACPMNAPRTREGGVIDKRQATVGRKTDFTQGPPALFPYPGYSKDLRSCLLLPHKSSHNEMVSDRKHFGSNPSAIHTNLEALLYIKKTLLAQGQKFLGAHSECKVSKDV